MLPQQFLRPVFGEDVPLEEVFSQDQHFVLVDLRSKVSLPQCRPDHFLAGRL